MEQNFRTITGSDDSPVIAEQSHQYNCPFLGASEDPTSVMGFPTTNNRCYALGEALEVDREKQRTHCLTEDHSSCHILQQVLVTQSENNHTADDIGLIDRVLQTRSLALAVMLLLIILAALIWWPFPGLSAQDGTVFSASFMRNSQGDQMLGREPSARNDGQSILAGSAGSESISLPAQPAVSDQPELEAGKATAVPPLDISDLPDLYQLFQFQQEAEKNETKSGGGFSPIAYSNKGVEIPSFSGGLEDEETLRIFLALPDRKKSLSVKISRLEQVNILGRDSASEWLKVRTDSGIEGWIRGENTELGDWIDTLSVAEEAGESLSVPTTLPTIATAVVRDKKLAIHTAPRMQFKVITTIDKGEIVSLLGRWKDRPWVRIRLDDGTEGWIDVGGLASADS